MAAYTESIEKLIDKLVKLPGLGRRSAERIVSYILNTSVDEVRSLAEAIVKVKENVRFCRRCHNLSEEEECSICTDPRRNQSLLCVVERPHDVVVIEKAGTFDGIYHVLLGAIAPLEGRGPTDLTISNLVKRIQNDNINEVIIATDSDTEGEATALYLAKLIKPLGVNLSRIGVGLPVGSNIAYADSATLTKALEARRTL